MEFLLVGDGIFRVVFYKEHTEVKKFITLCGYISEGNNLLFCRNFVCLKAATNFLIKDLNENSSRHCKKK